MSDLKLIAQKRTVLGKNVKKLRKEGVLPAVLYGINTKTQPIQLDYKMFEKIYDQAGESSLVELEIEGQKPVKVIIQSVQRDALSDQFEHTDLYQVDLTKKITTEIELEFVGQPPAVKELGGVLVKSLDKIEVECLPQDLVHEIKVDVSNLKTFDDIIFVRDLKLPETITVKEKGEEPIASVTAPRTEEELKELDEAVEEKVDDVEVVKGKEKEESDEDEAEEKEEAGDKKKEDKSSEDNKDK